MEGLSDVYLMPFSAMPRRDRKAALYSLCAELAGCNVVPAHIAKLLDSHKGYITDVLADLGLHRRRRDRSAEEALKRLPADVRERIEAFRDRTGCGKC